MYRVVPSCIDLFIFHERLSTMKEGKKKERKEKRKKNLNKKRENTESDSRCESKLKL